MIRDWASKSSSAKSTPGPQIHPLGSTPRHRAQIFQKLPPSFSFLKNNNFLIKLLHFRASAGRGSQMTPPNPWSLRSTPGASDPPLEPHIHWVGPRWYGICGGSTIGTVSAVTRITWGPLPFHPFSCKFRIPVCYLPLWDVTG